ncbi:hypothetical protein F5146DRAFT_1041204 [Armillaria mellea]|nr:hypothetical protein F5146DRAFT_1041204 [Armillaria mellea]
MVNTRTVLVDDNLLKYSPAGSSQWNTGQGHTSQFINSSTHDAARSGLSFAYSFYGTSLAWTGVLWQTEDVSFSISVDNGNATTCNASGGDEESNIYTQLCQVNNLSNGAHTVNVTCRGVDSDSPVSIDYVIYTVDMDSNSDLPPGLSPGMSILIDDSDSLINYSGSWSQNSGDAFKTNGSSSDTIIFSPHGGGVHRSSSAGSRFTFQFSGSAVSIYGVQQLASGNLVVSFEIDGSPRTGLNISGSGNNDIALANLPLLSATGLASGDHEATVTIAEVSGDQILQLDFVVYEPIYGESEATGTSSSFGSGSSTSGSISSTSGTTTSSEDGGSKSNAGIIVGAVLASLVALAVLSSLAYWWWKRRHHAGRDFEIDGTKEAFQYKIVPTTESSGGGIAGLTSPPPALIAPATSAQARDGPSFRNQNVPNLSQDQARAFDTSNVDARVLAGSSSPYTQVADTPTARAFNSLAYSPPALSRDIPFARGQTPQTHQLNTALSNAQAHPAEIVYATTVPGTGNRRSSSHSTNDDPPPVPSKAVTGTTRLSLPPDRDVIASQSAILEKVKPPSPEPSVSPPPSAFPSASFSPVPSQSAKLNEVYANRRRASLDGSSLGTTSTTIPSQLQKFEGTDSQSNSGARTGSVSVTDKVISSQAAKLEEIQDQLRQNSRSTSPTGTLSPPSSASLLSPFSSAVASQAAILSKRRELMQSSADPTSGSEASATTPAHDAHDEAGEAQDLEEEEQVAELRRRNEMLVREIARLSDLPPPAYTDSSS